MDDILEYLSNILGDFDYKKLIFPTFIILLYVAGFTYLITIIKKDNKNNQIYENRIIASDEKVEDEYIYIDIKGAVANPGVYKLTSDSRVIDAVSASGGMTDEANTRFINLSKLLNDGDVIVVYSNKEISEAQKDNIVYIETPCICEEVKNDACYKEETNNSSKININTASIDELKTLDGIGDAKAKAIIEYRNSNGKFKSIDQLLNVNGISETIFSKIKENITV